MTQDELRKLGTGDVVRRKFHSDNYVVMANYGDRVTAVKSVDITNPSEWDIALKITQCSVPIKLPG